MSGAGRFTGRDTLRWSAAATAAVGLHAAALAIGYDWPLGRKPAGAPTAALMIDIAPDVSFTEQASVEVSDPGPVMEQAEPQTAASEPPAEPKADIVAPPAPVESDIRIVEQPKEKPVTETKHDTAVVMTKQAAVQPREKTERPPAPRTTAPPKAVRTANAAAPVSLGERTSSVSTTTYAALVAAHIGRFTTLSRQARLADRNASPVVRYSIARNGQLTSVQLASSSGDSLLDQEALAAVRRAQPVPPIPDNLPQPQILTSRIAIRVK